MGKYDSIIHLTHHVSKRHPRMSLYNRAAQFAPFAALNGHEEAIEETMLKNEASFEQAPAPELEEWMKKLPTVS